MKELESIVESMINKFPKHHRDDLRQECWAKITTIMDSYDPKISPLRTFLHKPLYNCCIDYLKLIDGNLCLSLDNETEYDGEGTTYSQLLPGGEEIEENYFILPKNHIPNRQDMNIMLRYYEGYKPKEILNLFANEHNYTNIKSIRNTIRKYNNLRTDRKTHEIHHRTQ